jgi:hypothetical protein
MGGGILSTTRRYLSVDGWGDSEHEEKSSSWNGTQWSVQFSPFNIVMALL